jgi:hypothetical protein
MGHYGVRVYLNALPCSAPQPGQIWALLEIGRTALVVARQAG